MSKTNPTAVGAFVIGAIALIVIGVLVFSSGRLFATKVSFVMYFEESVQGLNIGAPVGFRGVPVGEVSDIKAIVQADLSILIPVVVELDPLSVWHASDATKKFKKGEGLKKLVERGLRAQLATQSLLTGQKFVALEFSPDDVARFRDKEGTYPEIPTVLSEFDVLKGEVTALLTKIGNLPLEDLVVKVTQTVEKIGQTATTANDLIGSVKGDVEGVMSEAEGSLVDARSAIARLDKILDSVESSGLIQNTNAAVVDVGDLAKDVDAQVDPLATQISAALKTFDEAAESLRVALGQARETLATAEGTIEPDSEIYRASVATLNDVATAARELSYTAESIRVLTDYLGQNPESVIFGKPEGEQ